MEAPICSSRMFNKVAVISALIFKTLKKMYILLLLTAAVIVGGTEVQWVTAATSHIFTSATSLVDDGLTISWLLKRNETANLTLFRCTPTTVKMCDPFDDAFSELYTVNNTSNSTSLISTFTIKYVTPFHHNSTWYYVANRRSGQEATMNTLNVFAPADRPTCENVTIYNGRYLQINCFTTRVFPGSKCVFYYKTNNSLQSESKEESISYKHEQNMSTGYYKTNCTYNVSAAILGPGSHVIRVVMHPNMSTTTSIEKSESNTVPIDLYYPKAVLKPGFQENTFIKENVTSRCICYNNNTSILPSTVVWSNCELNVCLQEILEFKAIRNSSFQCTISNILNWKDTIIFQPNVSYPPDTVQVKINNTDRDICNDKNITLFGTCFVSESNPKPSVYISINNSLNELTSIANSREYVINKSMTSTGTFDITCIANSTEFSTTESNLARHFTIKGPPENPTIFKSKNKETNLHSDNVLEVTTGDTITCQSKGGYPLFKNISLTCGHEENHAMNQDQVSLILNFSSSTNQTCECIVWHESKCLQNRTTALIIFLVSEYFPVTGNTDQDFEKIYLGVGITVGCLVVVIVLIFFVSNLHQSKIKKISSDLADTLVNNGDLYFINKELSGFDMSIYPEYTNVLTTMSSAMEAPKNLKTKG